MVNILQCNGDLALLQTLCTLLVVEQTLRALLIDIVMFCADNLVEQTVQTPVDILTPCEAHCQLDNDSEPGDLRNLALAFCGGNWTSVVLVS